MGLLEAKNTLYQTFLCPFYVIVAIISGVLTVVINGVIDYFVYLDWKHRTHIVDPDFFSEIIIFHVIMAVLVFGSGKDIRKPILAKKVHPVTREALSNWCIKRVFFFSLAEPNWKKRLFMFIWNVLLFPGVFIFAAVIFLCWSSKGFGDMETSDCKVGIWPLVAVTESWKLVAVIIIHAMNWVATHNVEQPELAPHLAEDPEYLIPEDDPSMALFPSSAPTAPDQSNQSYGATSGAFGTNTTERPANA